MTQTTYQSETERRAVLTSLDTVEIDSMWGTVETIATFYTDAGRREYRVLDMCDDDMTVADDAGEEIYFWRLGE